MNRLILLLISGALSASITSVRAQSYSSVHYDAKDGLPSGTVYDITQDKNGFIWFGTENGLCRFDGKNFRTFTTKDGLPDNSILKVHGDNTGKVYFSPFTHNLYCYENDSFRKVPIPDKYKIDLNNISYMANKGNQVFVSGFVHNYLMKDDSLTALYDLYKQLPPPSFAKRVFDTLIILGMNDSLYYIPDSGKIRTYYIEPQETYNVIFDDRGQKRASALSKEFISKPAGYLAGNLLYCLLDNVIYFYNTVNGRLVYTLKADKFSNAFIDNEDNLWMTTLGDGVYRFPSFGFRNMDFGGKTEIYSLTSHEGKLIAGTDFSKFFSTNIHDLQAGYSTIDLSRFVDSSGNPVSRLTNRNRIYVLNATDKDVYFGADAFFLNQNETLPPRFKNIFPVKDIDVSDNNILISTGARVLLLDRNDLLVKDTLLRQRATCGVFYKGDYFIGTLGGLIKINSATKKVTELFAQFPLFRGRITALKRGSHDDLWVATSGSGLTQFKGNSILRTLREKDGLTSDICTSLCIDGDLLWLGTNRGLNRIEGNGNVKITRFTSASGLAADFINAVYATDSNVYVATAAGLTVFSKNVLTEKSVCILHILDISENNRHLKIDSNYTFPYNALNIRVDFTAISFKSAGDITYYYQLQGLDKNWNTTTANFINFSTLQPRRYRLYLKAVNKFGVESNVKVINITIQPAWWQTWLFRIIVLMGIGLIILLIYRYNIRSIKKKEEVRREFEARYAALEQKALQAQMNPHFIFNALNSIQTYILNLDAEGANNYLTNFASLIRQTLENSMQPMISLASEIKYLETYLSLEKLRFRNKFEYAIHVEETIDQNNALLPGMLLQPYIENSIRHGIQHRPDNNGLIILTVHQNADQSISYTITDNGVGRKQAEQLKSFRHIEYRSRGISINEKRIAAINAQYRTDIRVTINDIMDENGMVTGTSVNIHIPSLHKF